MLAYWEFVFGNVFIAPIFPLVILLTGKNLLEIDFLFCVGFGDKPTVMNKQKRSTVLHICASRTS